ncbi:MAG: phospho-N-acetylmuramoyl-pentapeptide-transferase [Chloroflexota bacterium]
MIQSSLALALVVFSFMMTVIWGEPLLRTLRHFKIGKIIRIEGPERHFTKMGTPTMGGILFILPVVLITLLLNGASIVGLDVIGRSIFLPLGTLLLHAILGAIDDWEGIRGKRKGSGMRARVKFFYQWILAFVIAFGLYFVLKAPQMFIPGVPEAITLGWWYIPLAAFLIVTFANAVNFTDGLDGLGGLISATAFAAYGAIALMQGQIYIARFCFTLVGALFGFLWFNVHPAQLMMGDLGSMALGSTLAVVALMTGQWLLLPIIAVIPVSEVVSVMLQVSYFKYTHGKRLFKMAPLHHHFELIGWSETQIVQRFWLIGLMAAMLGIALAVA